MKRICLGVVLVVLVSLFAVGVFRFVHSGDDAEAARGPVITVRATYPGASAREVADVVGAPIEQQVNGVEHMHHMRSRCTNDGSYVLDVSFELGTDPNMAQVLVQNRVSLAEVILPDAVKRGGVTVTKKSPHMFALIALTSPDDRFDALYLSNYATIHIKDELARVAGVGDVTLFAQQDYSVRAWLDPEKLAEHKLAAADVVKAIEQQNVQVVAGQLGQVPDAKDGPFELTFNTFGRLIDIDQLSEIILKAGQGDGMVRLRDVGRMEVGRMATNGTALLDDKPATILGVSLLPGADPGKTLTAVQERLAALRERVPDGLDLSIPFDGTANLGAFHDGPAPEFLRLDVELPAGASSERTQKVLQRATAILRETQIVSKVLTLTGPPAAIGDNRGCLFVSLGPADRQRADRAEVIQSIRAKFDAELREAALRVCDLSGRGRSFRSGYPVAVAVQDVGDCGLEETRKRAEELAQRLRQSDKLTDVAVSTQSAAQPALHLNIDRTKALALGVSINDVFNTLQVFLGAGHVNDVNRFGRTWQVVIQGLDGKVDDIRQLQVRNNQGQMVPLGAFVAAEQHSQPAAQERLDFYPMIEITANPAPGVTIAEARALCDKLAEEVRRDLQMAKKCRVTWTADVSAP
jgi:multidrug efflux pump subunit AcrB